MFSSRLLSLYSRLAATGPTEKLLVQFYKVSLRVDFVIIIFSIERFVYIDIIVLLKFFFFIQGISFSLQLYYE